MHCSYSRSHQGGVHLTPPASYVPRVSLPCARMYAPLMGGERRSPLTPRPFYCNAAHLLVLRCHYLLFQRVGKGEAAGFTGLNPAAFSCNSRHLLVLRCYSSKMLFLLGVGGGVPLASFPSPPPLSMSEFW